jgi:integrase
MDEEKKPERGSVYLRGVTYWIKYYKWGKPYRESAQTDNPDKALRFLKYKLNQIERARFVEPRLERIRVEALWPLFLANLQRKHAKDVLHVRMRWERHLQPFFANMRTVDITGSRLNEYVSTRQAARVKDSTIIRELAVLKRMFAVGYKSDPPIVQRIPPFPELKESAPRQGFLVDADYDKLARACAEEGLWLRAMLALAYSFGWRKSELLNLHVR